METHGIRIDFFWNLLLGDCIHQFPHGMKFHQNSVSAVSDFVMMKATAFIQPPGILPVNSRESLPLVEARALASYWAAIDEDNPSG